MSSCGDRDIFEDLVRRLGCEYITDMRFCPWNVKARREICRMAFEQYDLHQLEDIAEYLYAEKVRLENSRQAKAYFRRKYRQKLGFDTIWRRNE